MNGACAVTVVGFRPNIVANGEFSVAGAGGADVFASWSETASDGAVTRETAAGSWRSSPAAVKLLAGASKDTLISQDCTVRPRARLHLTIWCKGDDTNAGRYSVYDVTNSADVIALTPTGVTADAWGAVDRSVVVPAGCTTLRVTLECPDAEAGHAIFDDVVLR